MGMDYEAMLEGYDDAPEAEVLEEGALPSGWHPMEVVDIAGKGETANNVPWVRLQLKVLEGPNANRNTWVMVNLGASAMKREKDGAGNLVEKARTPEEFDKARKAVQGANKRLLRSMQLELGTPQGEGADMLFSAYRIEEWPMRQFMAKLRWRKGRPRPDGSGDYPPSNDLSSAAPLDDAKYGLAAWRAQQDTGAGAGQAVTI